MDSRNYFPAIVFFLVLLSNTAPCKAQLSSSTFYGTRCPNALSTIRTSIRTAVQRERRMAASLIRLHFHDCFVQGYEVIDAAKSELERICPGVVSCADILAVAARDASVAVGGPSWTVKLGRRDSTTASLSLAESNLPSFAASLETLISTFRGKGLSARDMVALSGAHTIGLAQCFTFRDRIYSNGTDIDANFASTRRRRCPTTSDGRSNLAPLDLVTPNSFDNNYFKNLIQRKGLLHSDQVLFSGGSTDSIVSNYNRNPSIFMSDFASAMVKMGDIDPLTGQNGIIRRICSAIN